MLTHHLIKYLLPASSRRNTRLSSSPNSKPNLNPKQEKHEAILEELFKRDSARSDGVAKEKLLCKDPLTGKTVRLKEGCARAHSNLCNGEGLQ